MTKEGDEARGDKNRSGKWAWLGYTLTVLAGAVFGEMFSSGLPAEIVARFWIVVAFCGFSLVWFCLWRLWRAGPQRSRRWRLLAGAAVGLAAILGAVAAEAAPGGMSAGEGAPKLALAMATSFLAGVLLWLALLQLARLQTTPSRRWWESSWQRLLVAVLFLGTLGAGAVAGQAVVRIAGENLNASIGIMIGATMIAAFGAINLVSRIKGVRHLGGMQQGGNRIDVVDSALPAGQHPDVLIVAMSRLDPARAKQPGRSGPMAKALQKARTSSEDPFEAFLQAIPDEGEEGKRHPWYQSARSLRRHFGGANRVVRPPKVLVVVSERKSADASAPETGPDVEYDGVGNLLGFRELLHGLMTAKFGEKAGVARLSDGELDMDNYSAVEGAVRAAVLRESKDGLARRRVAIDVTAGTKAYSVAACIATLDSPAAISYVHTQPPWPLIYRRLVVQR